MKKRTALAAAALLLAAFLWVQTAFAQAVPGQQVDILFTHDIHSHLDPFTSLVEGQETDTGGFARANTLIKEQRAKNPDTLVIDGGDFSMGSLI